MNNVLLIYKYNISTVRKNNNNRKLTIKSTAPSNPFLSESFEPEPNSEQYNSESRRAESDKSL